MNLRERFTIREAFGEDSGISRRVEVNSILAIVLAVGVFVAGMLIRDSVLTATVFYSDEQNGIRAQLPANWILSTNNPDYIFRVEDPSARPFKTLIQVSLQTVGLEASPRNVADLISIQGQARFTAFRELTREETRLGEDEAFIITYQYVETEPNPFLARLSIVVRGIDVVVLRGNQAVIFTFRDADSTFEAHRYRFDDFLATVEY